MKGSPRLDLLIWPRHRAAVSRKNAVIHSLKFLLEKASEIDDIENGRSVLVLLLAVVVP